MAGNTLEIWNNLTTAQWIGKTIIGNIQYCHRYGQTSLKRLEANLILINTFIYFERTIRNLFPYIEPKKDLPLIEMAILATILFKIPPLT